ncbi:hypothetical protein SAMD00019534_080170 [Acytostelium subglobosum LB1]|uniref:hypothetical protein n=1 Tax=Acytostelium subglobosum LB1 TaxID=1410327 RepID=UPI000644963F|nr:hypothetical protein SAMD00019534_080170 [Acytostelium subglobosum LB1]GAM24842.1 hypothetical protein SAMD00019534_080170 [Acytostelium subglobosum LB1]|eukprot:XP_012751931.1 hypothetical protein SAMD00019534_080170 [Acytostelium subglobosum LB1]
MKTVDEVLAKVGRSKIFSVIDLKSGFHHVLLSKESRQYTQFKIGNELYVFKRCAFGLRNSPAFFNRWINHVFAPLIKAGILELYVDDVIVHSKDLNDHHKHLKMTFDLLRKHVSNKFTRLKLSEEHRKDFQTIRTALCSDTCLIVPRKEVPLRVYTDASDFGTGLLIAQEDANANLRPVLFDSKKFNPAQRAYDTRDRELLGLINCLKKYQHLLRDKPFIWYTDHKNLLYEANLESRPARVQRWYEIISNFSFATQYIEGKSNCMSDYLSRTPRFWNPWDDDFIVTVKQSCADLKNVPKHVKKWFDKLKTRGDVVCHDGLYFFVDGEKVRMVIIDPEHIARVLKDTHGLEHIGINRLFDKVSSLYIWHGMSKSVTDSQQFYRGGVHEVQ